MQVFSVKDTYNLYTVENNIHYFLSYVSGETCDWHEVYWIGNENETFYKVNGNTDFGYGEDTNFGYTKIEHLKENVDPEDIIDTIDAIEAFKEKMKKFENLLKLKIY